jgi:hypothetical protein
VAGTDSLTLSQVIEVKGVVVKCRRILQKNLHSGDVNGIKFSDLFFKIFI